MDIPSLAIIVPLYNEEECIDFTTNRLLEALYELEKEKIVSDKSFIFYVNDGSEDNSWTKIKKYHAENKKIKGISFAGNFGNQKAILAGLKESSKYSPDCYITLDADLQQDENKIKEFIEKYKQGSDIVLGIRNDRKTDNIFKKITSLAFYKIMKLFKVNLEVNHSEYRLISSRVAKELFKYKEVNVFLRGIIQSMGFKKDIVYFDVKPRKQGKTKFTPFSLFTLAIEGITSFSIAPLKFITVVGFLMALASFIIGIYAIIDRYTSSNYVSGWATIVALIGFLSGIQILCLGIVAQYIGQLFQEVKARPKYIVFEELD